MWNPSLRGRPIIPFASTVFPALLLTYSLVSQAQQKTAAPLSTAESSLRTFLQNYLRAPRSDGDPTTRYVDGWVDLRGDGKREAIVYVTGRSWCGSGGCIMLVLAPSDTAYKVIAKTTITSPPIRVLADTSNGWHSIGVWVRGGGVRPGYEAELSFDGQTYPPNPSVAPARRLSEKFEGEVLILSTDSAKPLYP